MSGGALRRHALRRVRRLELPAAAERDLVRVIDVADADSLQLFYEAGAEAELERSRLETRGAAIVLCYCAGQLADDLADGDCTYLEKPRRTGPSAQFMLQNLFLATLSESGLPASTQRDVALELVRGAGAQQVEVRTRSWSLHLSRQVALGISGRQFAAYLRILWSGTPLEGRAPSLGVDLGFAAHVAADARTEDVRFFGPPRADRRELVALARGAAGRVRESGLRCVRGALAEIDRVLEASA